ncbi:phosphate transport system permease protein pstC [Vibrio sp. JCM 19236]|nr:phosphate transport system permease protein pstC [Vibrio sp. JCM 19236]
MLQETNRVRLLKDKAITAVVKASGLGLLVGLLGIFFYFISETLPIFSTPSHNSIQVTLPVSSDDIADASIDSTGENLVLVTKRGAIQYFTIKQGSLNLINRARLNREPVAIAKSGLRSWIATIDKHGALEVVMPEFIVSHSQTGKNYTPNLRVESTLSKLSFADNGFVTRNFVFAKQSEQSVFVRTDDSRVEVLSYWLDSAGLPQHKIQTVAKDFRNIHHAQVSSDGRFLIVLDDKQLHLFSRARMDSNFEEKNYSGNLSAKHLSKSFMLLSGERGAVTYNSDNQVELWFMVVNDGRRLTNTQKFQLDSPPRHLIPQHTSKGFWTVEDNGTHTLFYSTREEPVLQFKSAFGGVAISVLSENDEYLMSISGNKAVITHVETPHQQVSLKGLTQKIQYEGYAEPDYVWQTSAATEDVEPKFSLTPLVFGTLKAATYAMLFSIPIAVFGAVYTAFFMSARMRGLIKPTIELMEALPTLVIGFVAAIWLAPFMEKNLFGFFLCLLALPMVALLSGGLWSAIPRSYTRKVPRGLHLLSLLPILLVVVWGVFQIAPYLEKIWFNDGLIIYLADHGWDYQQRNSLIVGMAMGFAVIPTIFTIAEDAIFSVPKHLSEGSLALGATEWQTLTRVVLLTASPGIISAIMLGMGRAVGETMIVLTVTGNTPLTDWNVFEGLRSLTATIATELPESKVGSSHYRLLFLSALVLFLFTFIVNSVAESVRQRLRDKYRSL